MQKKININYRPPKDGRNHQRLSETDMWEMAIECGVEENITKRYFQKGLLTLEEKTGTYSVIGVGKNIGPTVRGDTYKPPYNFTSKESAEAYADAIRNILKRDPNKHSFPINVLPNDIEDDLAYKKYFEKKWAA